MPRSAGARGHWGTQDRLGSHGSGLLQAVGSWLRHVFDLLARTHREPGTDFPPLSRLGAPRAQAEVRADCR